MQLYLTNFKDVKTNLTGIEMNVSMYITVCQTYSQESPKALIDINLTHIHVNIQNFRLI